MRVVFDHRVEDHQQLAHAGGDDDLGFFAEGFQAIREGSDDWVGASCAERRHVQATAHRTSAAADRAPSSELAAIAIEGGQADQCGDFSSTQLPQLGDLGDQGCTRARSNPRRALNNLGLLFPLVVRLDQRGDSLLEASDLLVDRIDALLKALFNELAGDVFPAVHFRGSQLDELPAPGDKVLQFELFFRDFGLGPQLDCLAEACQHGHVDAIGLGQVSTSLAKSRACRGLTTAT